MRKSLLLLTILAFTGLSAAQPIETVNIEGNEITGGFFGPDSFLYPAQVGVDNLLNSDEENVVKRAIEANNMLEQGNAPAAERALNQLENNAEKSSRVDKEHLEEAQRLIAAAPYDHNARQGIDTARDAIENAQERQEQNVQKGRIQGFTDRFKENANNIVRGNPNDRETISDRLDNLDLPDTPAN